MAKDAKSRRTANLATPNDLGANASKDVAGGLNILLADVIALYFKTKNFHWHVSGPHFRDYHLLLDDQATQIDAMTDVIAERVRKLGAGTIKSVGHVKRLQRVLDNDADYVTPSDMLAELRDDNKELLKHMRILHEVADEHGDIATASLIENWVDETEQRVWFLFETGTADRGLATPASPAPVLIASAPARRPAAWRRASPAAAGRARARLPPGRRRPAPRDRAGRCTRRARPAPAP